MARKTNTKKRSQKSSASQKKQKVRKSNSAKSNSSFNYKSIPFALLLLITLAALLINTLPMFQENTENLIGRASYTPPNQIVTADYGEGAQENSIGQKKWIYDSSQGVYQEVAIFKLGSTPAQNEYAPTGRIGNYDASNNIITFVDINDRDDISSFDNTIDVVLIRNEGKNYANPADYTDLVKSSGGTLDSVSTSADLSSTGDASGSPAAEELVDDARSAASAAKSGDGSVPVADSGGPGVASDDAAPPPPAAAPGAKNTVTLGEDGLSINYEGTKLIEEKPGVYCSNDKKSCYNAKGEQVNQEGQAIKGGKPLDGFGEFIGKYSKQGDTLVFNDPNSNDVAISVKGSSDSVTIPKSVYADQNNKVLIDSAVGTEGDKLILADGSKITAKQYDSGVTMFSTEYPGADGSSSQTTNKYYIPGFENNQGEPVPLIEQNGEISYNGQIYGVDGGIYLWQKLEDGDLKITFDEIYLSGRHSLTLNLKKESDGGYDNTITQEVDGVLSTERRTRNGRTQTKTSSSIAYDGKKAVEDQGTITYANGKSYRWNTLTSQGTSSSGDSVQWITDSRGNILAYNEKSADGSIEESQGSWTVVSSNGKTIAEVKDPRGLDKLSEDGIITKEEIESMVGQLNSDNDCSKKNCGKDELTAAGEVTGVIKRTNTFTAVGAGLSELGSGRWYSNLIYNAIDEGQSLAAWDRWYAGSVLNENYWESLICKGKYPDIQDAGVAFVETPAGTFQGVGAVNAEIYYKSDPQEMLCYPNEEGEVACPLSKYECRDDTFCVDEDDEIVMGYRYKISWAVTSPADEALTPFVNENGYAVSYNIVVSDNSPSSFDAGCQFNVPGCVRLYSYEGDDSAPLQLVNAESDGQTLVLWSTKDNYQSVCIDWGFAPYTISYGLAGREGGLPGKKELSGSGTRGATQVNTLCVPIIDATAGTITAENFPSVERRVSAASGSSATPAQSVTTGDVQIASLG